MNNLFFSHGRTALKYGLKNLNIKKDSKILLPGYICHVVVDAIKEANLNFVYYKNKNFLEPDWEDINKKYHENINIAGIMCVHYFGNPQNIKDFMNFSKKNNIYLIEDNAHGYMGRYNNKQLIGSIGDIGISSPRKQLDLFSGGSLLVNSKYNFQSDFINYLEKYPINLKYYNLRQILKNIKIINRAYQYFKKDKIIYNNPDLFREPKINDYLIDEFSKKKINSKNFDDLINLRRANYFKIEKLIKNLNISPIIKNLSQYCNPWCYPIFTKNNKERIELLEYGQKNNLKIFTWPTLPKELIKDNSEYLKIWESILCISTDDL